MQRAGKSTYHFCDEFISAWKVRNYLYAFRRHDCTVKDCCLDLQNSGASSEVAENLRRLSWIIVGEHYGSWSDQRLFERVKLGCPSSPQHQRILRNPKFSLMFPELRAQILQLSDSQASVVCKNCEPGLSQRFGERSYFFNFLLSRQCLPSSSPVLSQLKSKTNPLRLTRHRGGRIWIDQHSTLPTASTG